MKNNKFICSLGILLTLSVANMVVAQQAVQITPIPEKYYLFGLPIMVKVQVKNVSDQTISVFSPSQGIPPALNGTLKKETEATTLKPNASFDYFQSKLVTVKLKANEIIWGTVDVGKMYDEGLPAGRYISEVTYGYGAEAGKLVRSEPFLVVIQEPTDKDDKEAMNLFLNAKNLHFARSFAPAIKIFDELIKKHANTEYAKAGLYYQARAYLEEKQYEKSIVNFQQYLLNPTMYLPEVVTQDYINFLIGRAYFEDKKFKEAKQAFEKVSDSTLDTPKDFYMQKIEQALR